MARAGLRRVMCTCWPTHAHWGARSPARICTWFAGRTTRTEYDDRRISRTAGGKHGRAVVSRTAGSCSAHAEDVVVVALAARPVQGAHDRPRVVVGAGHVERHAVATERDPAGLR